MAEHHLLRRGLVVALATLVAACGTTGTATTSTSPETTTSTQSEPPEWLELTLRYSSRHSLGKRRLDVVTTNNGLYDVIVTEIALRAEYFTELPPEAKTSRIMSGLTVAVKTDFGEVVDCEAPGQLSASVALGLLIGESQSPQHFEILVDPEPLDVIRTTDCNTRLVAEAAAITFEEEWVMEDGSVVTELIVARGQSTEPITIASVRGMILYGMEALTPLGDVVAVLGPDEDEVRIPVRLTMARCDVHAVSQAPDGYSFRVWIGVGDGEPILTTVRPDDLLQEELESVVLDCAETLQG